MEKLVRPTRGTRFLGISNFNPSQLDALLKIAKIKPYVHQFEAHPYLPQTSYVERNLKEGITVTAYSPLGNTNPSYAEFGARAPPMLSNKMITDVAAARGCTPAQVALAWNVKRGVVVIPKAVKPEHQKENIATYEKCKLQDEDMAKLNNVGTALRVNVNPCKVMDYHCFDGLDVPRPI
jgi:alcohol dehydrogenase (NADP+)